MKADVQENTSTPASGPGTPGTGGEILLVISDLNAWGQPYTRNLVANLVDRGPVTILGISWGHKLLSQFDPRAVIRFVDQIQGIQLTSRLLAALITTVVRIADRVFPRARLRELVDPGVLAVLSLAIRRSRAVQVIAVDPPALLACRLAGRKAHLVSLHLPQYDACWWATDEGSALSVVTQNSLRYDALFPSHEVPCFVVPNFPIYRPVTLPPRKEGLLYAGSVFPGFGLDVVLDYVAESGRTLTILGKPSPEVRAAVDAKYGALLASGRVRFINEYLLDDEYAREIAQYQIAFSFYDLRNPQNFFGPGKSLHPWSHLNFWTGFPGKVGVYASTGVPVIVNDLPGLQFVGERRIGVVVKAFDPETIGRAVREIEASYDEFSRNCVRLAQEYCFSRNVAPFVRFLEEQESLGKR